MCFKVFIHHMDVIMQQYEAPTYISYLSSFLRQLAVRQHYSENYLRSLHSLCLRSLAILPYLISSTMQSPEEQIEWCGSCIYGVYNSNLRR